jgi:glycosyltransferase involved in cell wall biosynthesis
MLVGLFPPSRGGMTTFLLNLVDSYLAASYDFEPFNISRPPKRNVIDNWGYGSVWRGGIRRIAVGLLVTAWHLVTFPLVVVVRRIDLIQVHASDYQQFWEAVAYVVLGRLLGRPVLMRIGGALDRFYEDSSPRGRRAIRKALGLPHVVIAQSEYWRDFLSRLGRKDRVVVLNNFVPERDLGSREEEAAVPCCLFLAGTEARRKGLEVVLDAARLLHGEGNTVRMRLVAVPDNARAQIQSSGLGGMIEILGPLSRQEVLREMRQSDIFLLPSYGEGFPNSLIEAMAQGMAAVVTPVGAVGEVVANGDEAIVVPVGDPAALADAVGRLVDDPELRERMGRRSREIVRSRFTPSAVLPALEVAYRHLLGDAVRRSDDEESVDGAGLYGRRPKRNWIGPEET